MRYAIDIHPDDAAYWKDMTGRDEKAAEPIRSRAGLEHLVDSAYRNGIRLAWRELGEGDDR